MTDPMMDFFDDANLFGGGLEGLTDDSFAQTDPVSLVDELGLGAEFEPLQVEPLGQVKQPGNSPSQPGLCFEQQMSQFEPLKGHHHHHRQQGGQPFSIPNESNNNVLPRHSQYTASPVHQPSQLNGLFPDVADGSPMWGNQNGAQFHQHHGNLQSLQPQQQQQQHSKCFAAHDFSLFQTLPRQQKQQQQQHRPPHTLQRQQQQQQPPLNKNVGPFNPGGQEAVNQSSSFLEVHSSSPMANVHQPDRLSSHPAPCQANPAVSAHHFSNPAASVSLSFPGLSSSSTLNLPACSVNASSLLPPSQYSFSGTSNGGTLLSSTPGSGHSLGVADFPGGNGAFLLMAGTNRGASLQPSRYPQAINPSCENAFQTKHSGLGSFNGSPMSTEDMSCYPAVVSRSSDTLGLAIPPAEPPLASSNGFPTLEEHLLQQVQSHSEAFPELDTVGLLEEDLLPQFEAAFGPQDPGCTQDDSGSNDSWPEEGNSPGDFQEQPPSSKNTNGSGSQSKLHSPQVRSSPVYSERRLKKAAAEAAVMMEVLVEDKQEKANRIISEAIAKAKERGEKNIPRVMSSESFPSSSSEARQERKAARRLKSKPKPKDKLSKKAKSGPSSKSKQKTKIGSPYSKRDSSSSKLPHCRSLSVSGAGTMTPKPTVLRPMNSTSSLHKKIVIKFGKKKRKSESSDEESDSEPTPRRSSKDDDSKRRSNRQVKRKKYAEEGECKISDEEKKVTVKVKRAGTAPRKEHALQLFVENPSEEDAAVVDKIMSSRRVKKEVTPGVMAEVEEFYVKYKNYSYLHCEWATEQQLLKDKRIHLKIKRFKIKQAQRAHFFADMEEDPFNPDYVEVDRVLDVSYCEDKDTGEPLIYYLVKWSSLPYEDSTWELKEDVDQSKIEEFELLQAARADPRRRERPPANMWKKKEESREYQNGNQLRDYQLEGVNWLLFNWYNRRNCILADEMGLGKTIQSITFLEEIYLTGIRGPFLIIAPLSTIANWEREFRTWTHLNVIVYHGSMISRQMLQQYEMYCRDSQGRVVHGAYKFQAIITTFEMILGGSPELNAIEWRCVIIDEAHRLKNKNCKLLEGFKLMNLDHKVLLTGTPLQNTVEELFSLLHFLEPSHFPSESTFMQEFGDLRTEEQVQKLHAILKPMMLRRLKEDVEKKLAPKQETIIEVELTNIQKKYYRAILEKNFSFLSKGVGQANVPNLVNTMMELRKCCNHPYLIKGAEEKILEDFRETYSPASLNFHLQAMIQSAGKLVLIDKLLPKMKAGGHKVLIFSQMVRCLDILEDYLIQRRYLYERIDGRVRGNLRQAAIDRFSKPDSDRFVFLLCTRAGGLGINLTAADTCIIFDSDWNPQNDLQAQARCHRIGQDKAVKVYRLITRNSYEREMFDRASLKLGLDKAVLQSMSGRDNSSGGQMQQLSKKEIEDLLRRGAYGAIMDEEDEGSKFCEEDIDQILQRRTKTITIESEGRGSTFAKASFVASGNRTDISLDDPNFWDKWAKKAEIDMDALNDRNSLVIDTPRVRKQTRPFSSTKEELAELSEGESEGDDKPKLRRPHDRLSGYGRTECFRVEKNLLVYG